MAAKIATLLTTFVLNLAVGAVILLFLLVAMNGFSESDATWGLGVFVVLALLVSLSASVGAFFLTGTLIKRNFGQVASALIAVPIFSIVGIGLEIVCALAGVGVAEYVRVNH